MKIFVIPMLVIKIPLYFGCLCRAAAVADKRMEEIFKTDKKEDDILANVPTLNNNLPA